MGTCCNKEHSEGICYKSIPSIHTYERKLSPNISSYKDQEELPSQDNAIIIKRFNPHACPPKGKVPKRDKTANSNSSKDIVSYDLNTEIPEKRSTSPEINKNKNLSRSQFSRPSLAPFNYKSKPELLQIPIESMIELPEILSNRAEVIKRMDSINIDFQPDVLRRETSGKWQTKYEEIAFIDRGGFAEVRKIKDRQTGAIKAIKIMSKANCQMTDNSADEINILKKLVPILILIL